ncbi:colicin-like pore-forming protein [Candidatus Pantoea formicae]|uniref:colicin-like pore-forming protein n=1 Tax=Candidatus Pantoea formicae TaxID=2608355 RepID=UPI003ED8E506
MQVILQAKDKDYPDQEIWSRGGEQSNGDLVTEAYDGGNLSSYPKNDLNSAAYNVTGMDTLALDLINAIDGLNETFPIPQTPTEERQFNASEANAQVQEGLQWQQTSQPAYYSALDASLDAQIAYLQTDKTNALNYAKATLALATARSKEIGAYITHLQNVYHTVGGEWLYYSGGVWWPENDADLAASQAKANELSAKMDSINNQITENQAALSSVNADISQTQSDITNIQNGTVPDRFNFTEDEKNAEGYIENAISFFQNVFQTLGENAAKEAMRLANASVGKTISSYADAVAAWEAHGLAVVSKFSSSDLAAISSALESMDQSAVEAQFNKWAGYLGDAGKAMQIVDFAKVVNDASKSGNWNPVLNYVSAYLAGEVVASLTAFLFGSLVIGTGTAAMFGLLALLLATYADEDHMEDLSEWLDSALAK